MYKLKIYADEIDCDKAVKGADYIKAYLDGQVITECNGISDFSGYSLTDECENLVEFSQPEPTENQLIGQMITDLELAEIIQGQQATDLELRLLALEAKANV